MRDNLTRTHRIYIFNVTLSNFSRDVQVPVNSPHYVATHHGCAPHIRCLYHMASGRSDRGCGLQCGGFCQTRPKYSMETQKHTGRKSRQKTGTYSRR
ncbi:hypothetical protein ScPMuIL_014705 [Solemya velum]